MTGPGVTIRRVSISELSRSPGAIVRSLNGTEMTVVTANGDIGALMLPVADVASAMVLADLWARHVLAHVRGRKRPRMTTLQIEALVKMRVGYGTDGMPKPSYEGLSRDEECVRIPLEMVATE